ARQPCRHRHFAAGMLLALQRGRMRWASWHITTFTKTNSRKRVNGSETGMKLNTTWMRILGGTALALLLLVTLAWAGNNTELANEAAKQMAEATGAPSTMPWWAWPTILL